jgi:hypothetical protein
MKITRKSRNKNTRVKRVTTSRRTSMCKCIGNIHKKTCKKYMPKKIKRGGGYGGNPFCNNPNFNIFNTNLLKLFPYKP